MFLEMQKKSPRVNYHILRKILSNSQFIRKILCVKKNNVHLEKHFFYAYKKNCMLRKNTCLWQGRDQMDNKHEPDEAVVLFGAADACGLVAGHLFCEWSRRGARRVCCAAVALAWTVGLGERFSWAQTTAMQLGGEDEEQADEGQGHGNQRAVYQVVEVEGFDLV